MDVRLFFNPHVVISGSHRESIRYVKECLQGVDVAAIDCITYKLIQKYAPQELQGIACIGETLEGLTPPFVSRRTLAKTEGLHFILCDAFEKTLSCNLGESFKNLSEMYELRSALDALYIKGFRTVNPGDYKVNFLNQSALRHVKFRLWKEPLEMNVDKKKTSKFVDYYAKLDMCPYFFGVNTTSPACQRWFNRGMLLAYNFNHDGARECFFNCLKEDAECIMAYWGICYVSGIYYNNHTCAEDRMKIACKYATLGISKLAKLHEDNLEVSVLEELLMRAIECRAIHDFKEDSNNQVVSESNIIYSRAMYSIYTRFPLHPDVISLLRRVFNEFNPWKLWPSTTRDRQIINENDKLEEISISGNTFQIKHILEIGIKNNRPHPGLAHFYVHAVEQAPFISMLDEAIEQSHLLRSQWPAAGHLLHMASHIDMQLGKYKATIEANSAGILQDDAFAMQFGNDNYYHGYKIHNYHMLVWGPCLLENMKLLFLVPKKYLQKPHQKPWIAI